MIALESLTPKCRFTQDSAKSPACATIASIPDTTAKSDGDAKPQDDRAVNLDGEDNFYGNDVGEMLAGLKPVEKIEDPNKKKKKEEPVEREETGVT